MVVSEEGFDEALDITRARIDEIEGNVAWHLKVVCLCFVLIEATTGLHRQNELTIKEPFRVLVGRRKGKTTFDVIGLGGSFVAANEDDVGVGVDGDENLVQAGGRI